MSDCLHCSTPLRNDQDRFCCNGCASVYEIIHDSGFEKFYDLKADTSLTPLNEKPFQERDWTWVSDLIDTKVDGLQVHVFGINGMSCVACIWLVESIASSSDGIVEVNISIARGSMELSFDPKESDLAGFADRLYRLGYEVFPSPRESRVTNSLAIQLGVCGSLAMITMSFTLPMYAGMDATNELHELFTIVVIATSTLAFIVGGGYFFKRAWNGLKMGAVHMDLPIALGLIIAYAGSLLGWALGSDALFYFDFVAIFTFLMLLGKQVQNMSLNRVNARFNSESVIPEAYETKNGQRLFTSELNVGDRVIIPAGTVLPAAAILRAELAECSLAWITGEPTTSVYKAFDTLPAGAVNQSSDGIEVELCEPVDEQQFFYKIPQKGEQMPPYLMRFIRIYLIAILVIGVLAGTSWLVFTGDVIKAVQVVISVYVVSCPCGIGLALPLLDIRYDKLASRMGAFPLTTRVWPSLAKVTRVVFDKTGTLTLDRPQLRDLDELDKLPMLQKEVLLKMTAKSQHPLSRSLFGELVKLGVTHSLIEADVRELAGQGVFLEHEGVEYDLKRSSQANDEPTCSFWKDGEELLHFNFSERPREHGSEAIQIIDSLLKQPSMILSGDGEASVSKVAGQLGIKYYSHSLKPEDKKEQMLKLEAEGSVFYLGDGINDLPALRSASLSAAPFANVNLLTDDVDVLFTDETLGFLPKLFSLARERQALFRQVVVYTVIYNVAVVAVAVSGIMSPLIAAIIMPLSSLISLSLVVRGRGRAQVSNSMPVVPKVQPSVVN